MSAREVVAGADDREPHEVLHGTHLRQVAVAVDVEGAVVRSDEPAVGGVHSQPVDVRMASAPALSPTLLAATRREAPATASTLAATLARSTVSLRVRVWAC